MDMDIRTYTDGQATDEAIRLAIRKLHRLYSTVHADLMSLLPAGIRDALNLADIRADTLRANDKRDGIDRRLVTVVDRIEAETAASEADHG